MPNDSGRACVFLGKKRGCVKVGGNVFCSPATISNELDPFCNAFGHFSRVCGRHFPLLRRRFSLSRAGFCVLATMPPNPKKKLRGKGSFVAGQRETGAPEQRVAGKPVAT
jgi:hypothetical protein